MKTILTKLSDKQAHKELRPYALWATLLSGVSLVAFWFLGIAGLALGARALLLTWHKANVGVPGLIWYRIASIFAVVAGLASVIVGISQ